MKTLSYYVLAFAMVGALIKYGVVTVFWGGIESVVSPEPKEISVETVEILPEDAISPVHSNIVYVTTYGEKYHREQCSYLLRSKKAISLEQAIEQYYRPCTVCNP